MLLRTMTEADLGFAVECTTDEGWLGETEPVFRGFLGYDPRGCSIAEEDGRRVGMCVAIAYETCGFLAELIVVKDRRGHGIGRQLMEHSINYLHGRGCRSIYLDGDTPAVPLYERLGFVHLCKSLRFLGRVPGVSDDSVRPMTREDIEVISPVDRRAFGADRRFFLDYRLGLFPRLCKVQIVAGEVAGYIMGQPGAGVVSVGPWVVADEVEHPLDLLESLAEEVGEDRLRIGVLESNASAVALLRSLPELTETEPSWRMVLGPDAGLGAAPQLFAIGSAAKG